MRENFKALSVFVFNCIQSNVILFYLRHAVLRAVGCRIGAESAIHRGVRFLSLGRFSIGNNSTLGWGSLIDNRVGVSIGNCVSIAHRCSIYSLGHDPHSSTFSEKGAPVVVGDYVCILANVTIMPGVRIGEGAFIYSNAVVTRDVEPRAIIAGVPARVIGVRTVEFKYKPNYRIWFGR